jgi:type IV pilus assembly protein PilA
VIGAIHRRMHERDNGEGGFTLIELMVVVMIIAILIGIAIPAFLGARKRAQDTASKSNLRNALSSATAVFSDNQTYPATADSASGAGDGMVSKLIAEEPSLSFVDGTAVTGDSTGAKSISVLTKEHASGSGIDEIILSSFSDSKTCFYLRHVNTPSVSGMSGTYKASVASAGSCSAADGDALAATAWSVA